jgi:hypothetical protein
MTADSALMEDHDNLGEPGGHRPPLQRHACLWVALLAEILLLAALHRFDDWRYADMPIKFVEVAVLSGIAFFAAASFFAHVSLGRRAGVTFWVVAILLRIVALPIEPGDDLWRYQWEGRVQNAGFNPYVLAPNDEKLVPLRAEFANWSQINHRDFSAIYPPGTVAFAALSPFAAVRSHKLLFAAADLAAIAVLLRLIGGATRFADAALRLESTGRLQLRRCGALRQFDDPAAARRHSLFRARWRANLRRCRVSVRRLHAWRRRGASPSSQTRWAILGAIAMGLAISIKLVPVLLLPLCAFALGRRALALGISLAIPAALSLPFGFPHVAIWNSLGRFIYVTRLNDMFWWIIEDTVWPNPHQKNYHYNVIIIVAVLIVSVFFVRNWKRGLLWVMGTALFLSPVLHPWYCTWILPLADGERGAWRRARPRSWPTAGTHGFSCQAVAIGAGSAALFSPLIVSGFLAPRRRAGRSKYSATRAPKERRDLYSTKRSFLQRLQIIRIGAEDAVSFVRGWVKLSPGVASDAVRVGLP